MRQLRLRDLGGIIVIDFIDMVLESNRDLVLRRLVECLGRDRTRHQVAEVTSLGLVQMTRKRIGTGLLESFSHECESCRGRGVQVSESPVEPKKDEGPRRGRRGGKGNQKNQNQGGQNQNQNSGGQNQSQGKNKNKAAEVAAASAGAEADKPAESVSAEPTAVEATQVEAAAVESTPVESQAADSTQTESSQPEPTQLALTDVDPEPASTSTPEPAAEASEPAPANPEKSTNQTSEAPLVEPVLTDEGAAS